MNTKSQIKSNNSHLVSDKSVQNKKIESIIKYGETKIKQINKKVLENEVKLESMESHSDYEYKDLLREFTEAEKEHTKDLKLFVDLLSKYELTIK